MRCIGDPDAPPKGQTLAAASFLSPSRRPARPFTQYTMTTSLPIAGDVLPSGSASSIVAGAVSGYHLLNIAGYSRTKEVPNGKWIDSCSFRVGGRSWHVSYYPNGMGSKDIDFISLILTIRDTPAETVKAQVKFSLLNQDGKPVPAYTKTAKIIDFSVTNTWGFYNFIRRETLEKSEHLKDDSFTVKVDVTVMSGFQAQETPSIVVPPSDMHRHFGDLLSTKEGVDVKFQVGREAFSAHRLVLAARSPVFRAQFFGPMKEGTTTRRGAIRIDDMEAEVFKAMLTFMYTDALPDMDQGEECAMAQHLLVAADRYDLDRLKLICQDKLSSGIDTSSVATILALADQHHCHELKAACLKFLSSPTNLVAAMESEGFELLTKSCPGVMKDLLMSQVVPTLPGKRKSRE